MELQVFTYLTTWHTDKSFRLSQVTKQLSPKQHIESGTPFPTYQLKIETLQTGFWEPSQPGANTWQRRKNPTGEEGETTRPARPLPCRLRGAGGTTGVDQHGVGHDHCRRVPEARTPAPSHALRERRPQGGSWIPKAALPIHLQDPPPDDPGRPVHRVDAPLPAHPGGALLQALPGGGQDLAGDEDGLQPETGGRCVADGEVLCQPGGRADRADEVGLLWTFHQLLQTASLRPSHCGTTSPKVETCV